MPQSFETVKKKSRNLSFRDYAGDLDVFKVIHGGCERIIRIPAVPRSNGWGILLYMLENHSRKVYDNELVAGVEAIMREVDEERWDRFVHRESVKTMASGVIIEKKPQSWQERLITNAKNYARIGQGAAYGRRLIEQGVVLRHYHEIDHRGYFIMHMEVNGVSTAVLQRGQKKGTVARSKTPRVAAGEKPTNANEGP